MAVKAQVSITISHLIDISSITRYYLLQSSTSAAPAKPTTNPPSSSWTTTEPSYTSGSTNTLYFVDCTEFTNGAFKYSEVSKSSSYEAAKEAYNKATAVETRVTNTETAIEQNKEAIELRATKSELTSEIDNVQDAIDQQGVALTKTITDYVSAIQTNADSISASVEKLEAKVDDNADDTNAAISELRQKVDLQLTEDAVNIQIDKKLQNGVDRVETSTGFKFDENGLNISKSGSTTNTQITENGMSVKNTETNEDMLTANKDGVDAKNLRASTYLIIGGRSRFENYGSYRTGCFWTGPSSGVSYPVTNPAFVIEELTAQNNEIKSALQTISDRLDTIT